MPFPRGILYSPQISLDIINQDKGDCHLQPGTKNRVLWTVQKLNLYEHSLLTQKVNSNKILFSHNWRWYQTLVLTYFLFFCLNIYFISCKNICYYYITYLLLFIKTIKIFSGFVMFQDVLECFMFRVFRWLFALEYVNEVKKLRNFAVHMLITQAQIWETICAETWQVLSTSLTARTWKILTNMLYRSFLV